MPGDGSTPKPSGSGRRRSSVVIEAMVKDGTVIAIVRDFDEAGVVQSDGSNVKVYAASEIAR